jgi:Zn-dependent protease
MGWQDRPYYRDQGASPSNPLQWIMSGSVPLFTVFGIRVRMHASLVVLIVLELLLAETRFGLGIENAMIFSVVLFGIVLLHEFGHCFAARSVGGTADDILLTPLGGLAFVDARNRPWPQLVTAAGGPLVNVAICLFTAGLVVVLTPRHSALHWNPLTMAGWLSVQHYLRWIFAVSMALLIFNILPILYLDGGRILQTLLWFKLKYYRATIISCVVGMIGSVLMVMYGIATFGSYFGLLLIFIGLSCFMYCLQLRAQVKAAGPWEFEDEGIDYSASLWQPDEPRRKHRKLSRRVKRRLRKQAQHEESEQARIDSILAKVSAHGMQSLTWSERRVLRKATERQRRREVEVGDL